MSRITTKKTVTIYFFPNKSTTFAPISKRSPAEMAQLVEQFIRNE